MGVSGSLASGLVTTSAMLGLRPDKVLRLQAFWKPPIDALPAPARAHA